MSEGAEEETEGAAIDIEAAVGNTVWDCLHPNRHREAASWDQNIGRGLWDGILQDSSSVKLGRAQQVSYPYEELPFRVGY